MAEVGKWPIEVVSFFVFSYYPTNGVNEEPAFTSNLLATYDESVQASKDYITAQANAGVCIIQPIVSTIVFPFVPWEAF